MRSSRLALIAPIVALLIPLAACGDDESADDPPTTESSGSESGETVPSTDGSDAPEIPDLPEVEFKSDPVDGGALFGDGGSDDSSADTEVVADPPQPGEEANPPVDPETEELSVEPCPPDADDCVDVPDVIVEEPHVVADEWIPFCGLLEQLEDEPIPSDELEQLQVIDVWLTELRVFSPPVIAEQMDTLLGLLDLAIEAESFDPLIADDEGDRTGERAATEIGDITDLECYGRA